MEIIKLSIDDEDSAVIGSPDQLSLALDIGQTGRRGSLWFTGEGEPGPDKIPDMVLVNDMYSDILTGYIYQYVLLPNNDFDWIMTGKSTAGPPGSPGIVVSTNPPSSTNVLWLDSTAPNVDSIIKGNGFPEGVVVAQPGTMYVDRLGTNGAWQWLKQSGNGNLGWVVINGDTGWRKVNAADLTNWHAAYANGVPVYVRTTDSVDAVLIGPMTATAGGGVPANARIVSIAGSVLDAVHSVDGILGLGAHTRPSGTGGRGPTAGTFYLGGSDIYTLSGIYADHSTSVYMSAPSTHKYKDGPWPKTLPGTAV